MEREEFGIKGVDSMVEGGIPKNSIIGLSGPPGVGKSIFALHFLLAGARKGQRCVYINLEEPRSNIENMLDQLSFGDEFRNLEEENKIIVKCLTYPEYEKLYLEIFEKISADQGINRLVIDSFNCFFSGSFTQPGMAFSGDIATRRMINTAFSKFRRESLTTMLVLEQHSIRPESFFYNIPHLVDGMINLDYLDLGAIERRVFISKMRWTDQYKESKSYEITHGGISVIESSDE